MAHVERPSAGDADQGEGLGQQAIERLHAFGAIAQGQALLAKLAGREQLELLLKPVDLRKHGVPATEAPLRGVAGEQTEAALQVLRNDAHTELWDQADCWGLAVPDFQLPNGCVPIPNHKPRLGFWRSGCSGL